MAYAVITSGSKQYRVTVGDVLTVDRLPELEKDGEVTFDKVLLVEDGEATKVGTPVVDGAKVTAQVLDAEARGAKGVAFKFKRRKGFHKKKGFRAALTKVKITAINA
ncbi:MAG: 50S ribosomal protein L21 [Akkermansiaceae bacterium]|nr:50S ribosomal protein L21 [Akkermansiaceae bacterium]